MQTPSSEFARSKVAIRYGHGSMLLVHASAILTFSLTACASPTPTCASRDEDAALPRDYLAGTVLDAPGFVDPQPCPRSSTGGSLRLLSWNIKAGRVRGLDAVIREIARWNPDVVLLQEVDVNVERSGFLDQPRLIAERLRYEFVFAPTVAIGSGLYGIAALSRVPLHAAYRIPLSNSYACEARAGLDLRLCFGAKELRIVNHHADYTEAAASASIDEIVRMITPAEVPTIFAGDLNQTLREHGPMTAIDAGLVDAIRQHNNRQTHGGRTIDFLFVDRDTARLITDAQVLTTVASDHSALSIDLQAP